MNTALLIELIKLGFDIYRSALKRKGKTDAEIDILIEQEFAEFLKRPASKLPKL